MIFELRSKSSVEYFIYRSKGLCMTDTMLKWNGGILTKTKKGQELPSTTVH